ncbi:MAG: tyrosine-type recombinase/integrase [Bacilli bacterium]
MYTLEKLIDKAYKELLDAGYSEKTVYSANWYIWNRLIREYGKDAVFKEEMIYQYCTSYFNRDIYKIPKEKLLKVERTYIIAFDRLIQSNNDIPFEILNVHYRKDFIISDRSESLLDGYLSNCKNDGNCIRTLNNKRLRIRNFIVDSDFDNLSKETAIQYLSSRKNDMSLVSYAIEMRLIFRFLLYCYDIGEISKEIISVWPKNFPNTNNKKIPSAYSTDEIKTLLVESKNFNREDNHLRNYAILCFIVYTGIRCSDVCNLMFSNIDWKNNLITIIQQKTKKQIIFPLIPEIGNPIIEYVQKERPKSNNKYVFLTEKGEKMNSRIPSGIIEIYFSASSINIGDRHYGAHALRHSLATNMINNSVPVFTIANTLGHSDSSCVHIYAKVNINSLRKCVLEVPSNA